MNRRQPAVKSVNESDEARAIRLRSYLHLFIVCAIVLACVLLWGFYRNRERFIRFPQIRKQ